MVQFSADELVACRMATNEMQFFDTNDFTKGIVYKVRLPGIAAMQLASAPGSILISSSNMVDQRVGFN